MTSLRRPFQRQSPDRRKQALISATLDLMASGGPGVVTVRAIADRAGISLGLIRHYFATKDDLLGAAYEAHMQMMTQIPADAARGGCARENLARFVEAALEPPVADARAVSIWAGFIHTVRTNPAMRDIHERTYQAFRHRLETLIALAYADAGRVVPVARRQQLAITCNAVIDGLWLEGGALPDGFAAGDLARLGREAVESLLNLSLSKTGD